MTDSLPDTHINSTFLDQQKVDFAYAIFWTKIARQWQPDYCAMVQSALDTLFQSVDFQNNPLSVSMLCRSWLVCQHCAVSITPEPVYWHWQKYWLLFQRLNETNA